MSAKAAVFTPPFCPATHCRFHRCADGWRYRRMGFYRRQASPTCIQRYRCSHCRRSFSTQTFSTTYWLRRPELLLPAAARSLGCSGFRQIARDLGVTHATVAALTARAARHALLFLDLHRPTPPPEPLVLDGFESFEFSQFYPTHFHLLVGAHSHFFYAFTDSELRRKGRMTPRQRRRRHQLEARLGRPDPASIPKEVEQLLRLAAPQPTPLDLRSDDHPAYPRALRRLQHAGYRIAHQVTPSTQRRTPENPLFPVNLLDLLIRHGGANHKRETIAFSKRRQSAAERLLLFQLWRNFLKSFSENRRDATPAMRLGLTSRPLSLPEIFQLRLLPSRHPLPDRLQPYYRRTIPTRCIPHHRTHLLRYAD